MTFENRQRRANVTSPLRNVCFIFISISNVKIGSFDVQRRMGDATLVVNHATRV